MSPIDFGKLGGSTPIEEAPADGDHRARLERAVIVDTKNGERLVTEWCDSENSMWTSWNRFDDSGMSFTQELLDGLGIDRSKLTEETLPDELARKEGATYNVRTESRQGSQGDRWFTSTYINSTVLPPQLNRREPPPSDAPADTRGLPQTTGAKSNDLFGDDDIPFLWDGPEDFWSGRIHTTRG